MASSGHIRLGGHFDAEMKNGRVEGKGKYTFTSGNVYEGDILDGQFVALHGKGTIHLKRGGKYEATWVRGVAQSDQVFTFADGLVYCLPDWDYCRADGDRRFYSERVRGIPPSGDTQITNAGPAAAIPLGTYDTGDGYYDPSTAQIHHYSTGRELRIPDETEVEFITGKCRQSQKPLRPMELVKPQFPIPNSQA